MSDERIVIVGGGPAGLSCARSYRERGGTGPLTLLAAEPEPPYRRPPLTKDYLRGELPRSELFVEAPSWYGKNDVELVLGREAVALDPDAGVIEDATGREWPFDACVLATGSRPLLPPLDGVDLDRVVSVRSIADSERLQELGSPGSRVLVVGSGFIGCEAAASLALRGTRVRMIAAEELPQLARLGEQPARRIAGWLDELGIERRGGVELERIEPAEPLRAIAGEESIDVDFVLLALGVERNCELASSAGLRIEEETVCVDERMRSSRPNVLAAGDLAKALNACVGRSLVVEHWGEALNHGTVAGAVLAGDDDARWETAPGFWTTIGDRTLKYVAWGDGFDEVTFSAGEAGAFTARYGRDGELVGVLTHEADEDYESGRELVEARAPWPG